MKKLSAILLICLISLHFGGYYFIYFSKSQLLENQWQSRLINNDFDQLTLQHTSLKIEFPYLLDQDEYVLVDEEMEVDGKTYRIIKKRYHQGTLDIIYVNDKEKEDLNTSLDEWNNDLTNKDTSSQNNTNIQTSFQYQYYLDTFKFQTHIYYQNIDNYNSIYPPDLFKSIFLDLVSPPPKFS